MKKETVLEQVLESDVLPTLSPVASRLISMTAHEDTTIGEIADLISRDISLSAKILRVVNSAFYGFPQQVSTIHQAASILGTNALRSLVLSFSFLVPAKQQKNGFDYARFWEKSLFEGVAARSLFGLVDKKAAEEAFVAGLLQNLGILILARAYPSLYKRIERSLEIEAADRCELERDIIGVDHPTIGYEVVRRWGFPKRLSEPLLYHHSPQSCQETDPFLKQLCEVVFLSGLVSQVFETKTPENTIEFFKKRAVDLLGVQESQLESFLDNVHEEVARAASSFDMKIEEQKSVAEVLQIANAELSVLNLSYEQMNRALVEKTVKLELLTAELEKKNKLLERLANVDGLTEAFNHRYFQDFLDREINRSKRRSHCLSLILVDIDHFKSFNDRFGHQAGDEVLRQFCNVCRFKLREYDLFARYGGEEFAIILPETPVDAAQVVAEKIRGEVAGHDFEYDFVCHHVTASFGVAGMCLDDDSLDKNQLISAADKALFQAKKKGRNQVVVYSGKKKWFGL
ncbi:MAG: GGDEF domain-containing protein [Syntrophotaleaceae bacterium]